MAKSEKKAEFIATRQGFYGNSRIRVGEVFVAGADEKFKWAVSKDEAAKDRNDGESPGEGLLKKSPQEIKTALSTKTQTELAELQVLEQKGGNRKTVLSALQDAIDNAAIPSPPAESGLLTPSHPTIPAGGLPTPKAEKNDPLR